LIIRQLLAGSLSLLLLAGFFIGESIAQETDSSLGQSVGSSQVATSSENSVVKQCATIRSWDGNTQRGGDLAVGIIGFGYLELKTQLLNNGVGILPGVAGGSLDAAALGAVDVFYWGTSSHVLTGAEATALNNFVQNGGWLIIETDSDIPEQTSANSGYSALGLGNRVGAISFVTGGIFENVVTTTTVGPQGDLRGLAYGTTPARNIDPTGHTLVGVMGGATNTWVEFTVGSGGVLGVGDPYGFNQFLGLNNHKALLNYILGNHCPQAVGGELIPLDATMVLLAGTQTIAAWMIPVIVSAIGIGIVIARKF